MMARQQAQDLVVRRNVWRRNVWPNLIPYLYDDLIPYLYDEFVSCDYYGIYVSPHIARAANLSFRLFSLNNIHSYCYRWLPPKPASLCPPGRS